MPKVTPERFHFERIRAGDCGICPEKERESMKHLFTLEQQLAGARKALAKLEQKVRGQPRYRGLLVGIKRNILKLEAIQAMPY
jgi:hypothetical protein